MLNKAPIHVYMIPYRVSRFFEEKSIMTKKTINPPKALRQNLSKRKEQMIARGLTLNRGEEGLINALQKGTLEHEGDLSVALLSEAASPKKTGKDDPR